MEERSDTVLMSLPHRKWKHKKYSGKGREQLDQKKPPMNITAVTCCSLMKTVYDVTLSQDPKGASKSTCEDGAST